ncbi:hypothetical protein ACFQ88_29455 [Paenibacillus sp. NPDC056579]|uniref:hypothetical protein n=1 Tax=Paenibacillus sp. NPDC056579 TaxID=3345871 RepID=UPI0036B1EF81
MSKRMLLGLNGLLLFLLLTACETPNSSTPAPVPLANTQSYGDSLHMTEKRDALYKFITEHLTGTNGIYTNLRDSAQSSEAASGHEVLSESAGLMLRYYAIAGQRSGFDAEWAKAKQTFDLATGFSYRYSPVLNKRYTLNAAVDDLRIIRALYEAGQAFKDEGYTTQAKTYGSRFYEHNVKDGYLYDFYDETYKTTNRFITLCYIDLKTLGMLDIESRQKDALLANMLKTVKKGYISDDFPFYETRYDYGAQAYSSEGINTVESLLTIFSLAEVRQHQPESIRFLKKQVLAGTLFGQYTRDGKPANDIRSTAIYAIAAMIGSELGDKELYEASIRRMNEFQIRNTGSVLDGGFGDTASMQAYSFDNLNALLAYVY